MELTIEQTLQKAVVTHKEGKLQDAERLYRAILQVQPNHPDVNHNLGVLAVAVGKTMAALPFFITALNASPNVEQFWLSYIHALIKAKSFDNAEQALIDGEKAEVSVNKITSLRNQLWAAIQENLSSKKIPVVSENLTNPSKSMNAKSNVSILKTPSKQNLVDLLKHHQMGRLREAEALAITLTQEFPNHLFAWRILGVLLKQTDRLSESIAPLKKIVELSPQNVDAHYSLGISHSEMGNLKEAEVSYARAIALNPDYAEAHNNLGDALKKLGKLAEAEASYMRAIALKPDYPEALNNLGITLKDLGRLAEAEASFRQSIALQPQFIQAHGNLGNVCRESGKLVEAEESYKKVITLEKNSGKAKAELGRILLSKGRHKEGLDQIRLGYGAIIFDSDNWAIT